MKKRFLAALTALCIAASMTACGSSSSQTDISSASSSSSSAADSSSSSESSSSTDSSSSPDSSAADTSSEAEPKYDYVHGTDGYYNMLDDFKEFEMKTQQAGTCWLYAATTSMNTAYHKQTGKKIDFSIGDLVSFIYGDDKQEGFFINEGYSKGEVGGWQWMVTDTLSRGYTDGMTLDSSVDIDPKDHEAIKNALRTRGAVAAETMETSNGKGTFGKYFTLNYPDTDGFDHDIALIGYDDNFPKEYFSTPASKNGAWIAYNSNMGDTLCYISYDSVFGYTVSHCVTYNYSEVLSYDAGNEMNRCVKTGDSTKTANVFHKKGRLAAVGTYNDTDKQDIKIEIMSADFKTVLYSQNASLDYRGYHTVVLDKPVDVEDYAVVITYSQGAPVEGELIENEYGQYRTVSEKGQSFVFVDGKWKDTTDSDIKAVLKTDFAPGNCCIKALYTK